MAKLLKLLITFANKFGALVVGLGAAWVGAAFAAFDAISFVLRAPPFAGAGASDCGRLTPNGAITHQFDKSLFWK